MAKIPKKSYSAKLVFSNRKDLKILQNSKSCKKLEKSAKNLKKIEKNLKNLAKYQQNFKIQKGYLKFPKLFRGNQQSTEIKKLTKNVFPPPCPHEVPQGHTASRLAKNIPLDKAC